MFLIVFITGMLFFQNAPEEGKASWYSDKLVGRPMAGGGVYLKENFTAAHRSLPFGTKVLVTNLNNGNSVEVIITDRGPFIKGRIIDLSRAAAEKLQMIPQGVVAVRVEILSGQ
jgi:rare lipoprotein A